MASEGARETTIRLEGLREDNLTQFKELGTAIFPLANYNDRYYASALSSGEFTRLAYYNDVCIGAIACQVEKKKEGDCRVYVIMLGVLAPYRRLGIGTRLVNHVLDTCAKQNVAEVYLHVQTSDDNAIAFYKTFGFEITGTVDCRAKKIDAPDCHILSKITYPASPRE